MNILIQIRCGDDDSRGRLVTDTCPRSIKNLLRKSRSPKIHCLLVLRQLSVHSFLRGQTDL
jgi:hypothetical protein